MTNAISQVVVVVPAHDEAQHIGRCLESLIAAAESVTVPVRILVVCDDCQDETMEICARFSVDTLAIAARSVGVARRFGVEKALVGLTDLPSVWIANTDADSVVPRSWLVDQLRLADLGANAVAGIVSLGPTLENDLSRAFASTYRKNMGANGIHNHVHGANLGVRASAYLDAGGFAMVPNHEDRVLLRALVRQGHRVMSPNWLVVETSGRLIGRCTSGFASALSNVDRRLRKQATRLELCESRGVSSAGSPRC